MEHEFFVVLEHDTNTPDYLDFRSYKKSDSVFFHDDFIWYIQDYLAWIPTINPANRNNWKGLGLNMYGPTIIDKRGALKTVQVFSALTQLFDLGPSLFHLRGMWSSYIDENGNEQRSEYKMILIDKDDIVKRFHKVIDFAAKVQHEPYVIVHMGI